MQEIENTLQNMYESLMATQNDFDKFKNGNKSAGTRLRKAMQDIKSMAQSVRVQVQEEKNAIAA
tara:strand:+ start:184 stop:375 length:192 start_codon:yes stop_codon:yes gene_type:complete